MNSRLANTQVIEAWINGEPATNHKRTLKALPTGELFSYFLKIGQRTPSGICVIGEYNSNTSHFKSKTTSRHISIAKRLVSASGGLIMHPLVWETSPLHKEELPF
jgi:hypothetical protein